MRLPSSFGVGARFLKRRLPTSLWGRSLLIIVLLVKPTGIFGSTVREKV